MAFDPANDLPPRTGRPIWEEVQLHPRGCGEAVMVDEKSMLAACAKALRERRGWTIAETARRADLSTSMLWKVENGQTTLTYGKLLKLADGLGVPIGELFSPVAPATRKGGRRLVERRGTAPIVVVRDNPHHFLATEIANKHNFPCLVEVKASGSGEDAETHSGEEFSYVIEGRVTFICEGYAPVVLEPGDSVYFDASQRHRYLCVDGIPARMLCIYSHPEHVLQEDIAEATRHCRAMEMLGLDPRGMPKKEQGAEPTRRPARKRASG